MEVMPWTPSDGPSRHTKKANTPATKKQWSDIANNVLSRGGSEGSAARIANAQVKNHPSHKKPGVRLAKSAGE